MAWFGTSNDQSELQHRIEEQTKIRDGAENFLSVFDLRLASSTKHDLRKQIESELETANAKIAAYHDQLERLRATSPPIPALADRYDAFAAGAVGRWPRETETSAVSRLELSALGLEQQSLYPSQAGPSRLPETNTRYQVSRMQDAFGTGSPPSTNLTNEIGSSHNVEALVGGLGIGLDGGFDHHLDSGRLAGSLASKAKAAPSIPTTVGSEAERERERDKENEDAQAMRSLATALIRSLRSVPTRNRSGSAPLLMSSSGLADESSSTNGKPSIDTGAPQTPSGSNVSLAVGPSGAPSRLNRRQISRNRIAALANGGQTGHVRTPSNASGLGDAAKRRIDTMGRLVNVLKRHARVRYELLLDDLVDVVMPCLADHAGKEVRASAYRLLRHALVPPLWPLISRCRTKGLDLYLSRTMVRDNRFDAEREQALKLIRTIMELSALRTVNAAPDRLAPDLQDLIGPAVIRAIGAVAEHNEDSLRHLCLETLAELAVFDVRLLIKGGGMRPTLQALVEGPNDFAPALVQTFLYLIDMPGTRTFLRPGVDLEVAISGLTESVPIKPVAYDACLRSTARVVSTMLRSWGGLLYMCMDSMRVVKSLVLALRVNTVEVKDTILDMLYDLFNVRAAAQTVDPASKRESGQKQSQSFHINGEEVQVPLLGEMGDQARTRLNLVDHYLALLLVVFIQSGLVDALVDVIEHTAEMSRKATLLMGELLQVSKRVHPPSMGSSIHSLPHLFALAASFKPSKSDERQAATLALASIDRVNRQRAHHEAVTSVAAVSGAKQPAARDRSNSLEETVRRGQRQVEKTKIRLGMQIDDNQFRNLLADSQVLNTKDHVKWNLDTLTEMLEGPLLNPRRLDEVARGTKLLKRLLAFFHPFSLRFSSIRNTSSNRRFVKLGCSLLSTLVCTAEGVRVLAEDRLLKEIRDCFEQLDPLSGTPVSDPLMSKSRLEETLTSGYFEMLGMLTQSVEGIRLLERHKVFTPLYHLSELRSREDVVRAVIENFDYSFDGHTRVVLSKALTSTYRHIRLFATWHLAELIRRSILAGNSARSGLSATDDAGEWMIGLLLSQLYDTSIEVRELAVRVLEESCASIEVLERVVAMRPTLDHLGDIGHPLLLKFLSTSVGFRYLWHGDYIDREMDHWFHERNHRYTVQVEVMLANFFSIHRTYPSSKRDLASATIGVESEVDGTVPPHFYGELAKTAEGCEILRQKGHLGEFAHFIRQHGMEHSDAELINKLKSVLWAVGNIGSTALGLPFLEAEDVVSQIVEIAENSLVMSVRGTCFFVLGLISATTQGAEVLQDYGWTSVCTPLGVPMGLCIPDNVDRLLSMPGWNVQSVPNLGYLDFSPTETVLENKVITSIANLGNSILANNASRTLAKLKLKHKSAFESVPLLTRAIEVMDSFYIRLPIRRYIWELFDIHLDAEAVERIQAQRVYLTERSKGQHHMSEPRLPHGAMPSFDASYNSMRRSNLTNDNPGQTGVPLRSSSTIRALKGVQRDRHPGLRSMAEIDSDEDMMDVDSDLDRDDDDDDDDDEKRDLFTSSDEELVAPDRKEDAAAARIAGNGTSATEQLPKSDASQEAGKSGSTNLSRSRLAIAETLRAGAAGTTRSAITPATVKASNLSPYDPPRLAITPKKKVLGFAV